MPQSHGYVTEIRAAILKQLHGNTEQIKMVCKNNCDACENLVIFQLS